MYVWLSIIQFRSVRNCVLTLRLNSTKCQLQNQDRYTSATQGKTAAHNNNQLVNQELADKCGLSEGPSVLCYKCEPQSVSENSRYKPSYDRPIITDRSIDNNRPDVVVFDKTVKEAYLIF